MKTVRSVLFLLLITWYQAEAEVPLLNSYPSATATIYLDFDGQLVSGTSWNWNGDINAQAAALSPGGITEIFKRVSEDFRIFDINVTTDSSVYRAAPAAKRIRVIITPTDYWYGAAGGISFIGSFTWGDDTPAWVFSQALNNNVKFIAEACSHETGHTLGLQHQSTYDAYCNKTAEYAGGQGNGEIGWAPIMGVGYYKNLTTWYNGKSAVGCSSFQNDIDRIATSNGFGLRPDEIGDDISSAADIAIEGTGFTATGIINSENDRDVFSILLPAKLNLRLVASPENVGNANSGADVDIRISLLSANADTIAKYNPSELLNAAFDTVLDEGKYYIAVEGVANTNLIDYGSVGHYALLGSINTPLPVHYLKLKGKMASNYHVFNWTVQSDEPLKEFELQFSVDGSSFEKLFRCSASQFSAVYLPTLTSKLFYRVKAITLAQEIAYYSNIISLPPGPKYHIVKIQNPIINDAISLMSGADCSYQLMMTNGQVLMKGKITKGLNKIEVPTNAKGMYLLRFTYVNEVWTEKIIKQ